MKLRAFRWFNPMIVASSQPATLWRLFPFGLPVKLGWICFLMAFLLSARATNLDTIGVTLLRKADPSLAGSGVPVAQPEGVFYGCVTTNLPFEVNPFVVGMPVSLFTYISSNGTATTFTNSLGIDSCHADSVAGNFYGQANGVATNIAHVDNYEANYFINNVMNAGVPITAKVVNQSFTAGGYDSALDQSYDNYAATYGTLFVSGAGNGGPVQSPATCYNGIGVGVYDGTSSYGPTPDGRSKPDITSPGNGATSFSTPYVSGAAAVLLQAANRGDGGANISSAADIRTIKALLLNGAIKPSDWTNSPANPLDARYGAGILNVFNSWEQLKSGQQAFIESTTVNNGNSHPPGVNITNEPSLSGWDFNSLSIILPLQDNINHYYFSLPVSNSFTLTATLAWNRQALQSAINDLNLFLYNASTSNLVACSTSLVDNVEHIFSPTLAPGRYDLQVLKRGNASPAGASETYALAFEFFSLNLGISVPNTNAVISWPIYPAGFHLESTTNLSPPVFWVTNTAPVSVDTNTGQNIVLLPTAGTNQFFRLRRP
jgi:hypothetical protein